MSREMCQGREGKNKKYVTSQLSTVGNWNSVTLKESRNHMEHVAQNYPTRGERELGHSHTCSHLTLVKDSSWERGY